VAGLVLILHDAANGLRDVSERLAAAAVSKAG